MLLVRYEQRSSVTRDSDSRLEDSDLLQNPDSNSKAEDSNTSLYLSPCIFHHFRLDVKTAFEDITLQHAILMKGRECEILRPHRYRS